MHILRQPPEKVWRRTPDDENKMRDEREKTEDACDPPAKEAAAAFLKERICSITAFGNGKGSFYLSAYPQQNGYHQAGTQLPPLFRGF